MYTRFRERFGKTFDLLLEFSEFQDSNMILAKFISLLHTNNFNEAISLYYSSTGDAKQLIDHELDKIPWRISVEYKEDNGKLV